MMHLQIVMNRLSDCRILLAGRPSFHMGDQIGLIGFTGFCQM